jgi:hypothetical protein
VSIAITADQRNLLYNEILNRLSGIGDMRLVVEKGDYDAAQRLGTVFSDYLRLVTEDLGWGEGTSAETIELKTPPDVLRRALSQMRDVMLGLDASEEDERAKLRENQERNRQVVETCRQVLSDLDGA